MKTRNTILSALMIWPLFYLLTGCSTMINGENQAIMIDSNIKGSTCSLNNDRGIWHVSATPEAVTIQRSNQNLVISCKHPSGLSGITSISPKANNRRSFMLGGFAAIAYDKSTGAAYDYPTLINVSLK